MIKKFIVIGMLTFSTTVLAESATKQDVCEMLGLAGEAAGSLRDMGLPQDQALALLLSKASNKFDAEDAEKFKNLITATTDFAYTLKVLTPAQIKPILIKTCIES